MDTKQQKDLLRTQMRLRRKKLPKAIVQSASKKITRMFLLHGAVRDAQTFFVYVSFGNEVATHDIITALLRQGKTVCVPKIVDGTMIAVQIQQFSQLRKSVKGYREPASSQPFNNAIDIAVVPGTAFTTAGARLGMGAGFYDRFFAAHRPRHAVALAYAWQIVPNVPEERHDRCVDAVMTEHGWKNIHK